MKPRLTVNIEMLRMTPVNPLHSQFLCCKVWQFAAGASTAGFLEKAAADLDRELRTFRYPAMSPLARITLRLTVDGNSAKSKEGAKCSRALCNIVQLQHRPPSPPRRDTLSATSESHRHRGGTDTKKRG